MAGSGLQVREVRGDELVAWHDVLRHSYFQDTDPSESAAFRRPGLDLTRTLGGFDGDRMVATLRSFATELTVGSGVVAVDAVTNVAVAATHRRRGLLTDMMRRNLAAAKERGDAGSILIASEAPIYGRYGYGPATEAVTYDVDPRMARFRDATPRRVEMVDVATMRLLAPTVYDRYRSAQPGAIARDDRRWDTVLRTIDVPGPPPPLRHHLISYDDDGRPDGYVRYHVVDGWEHNLPTAALTVVELVATSTAAHARLWRHCCEIDLVRSVQANEQSVDDTLPWLLVDRRAVRQTDRTDRLWLRVLDVPAVVQARAFAAPGRLVVEVVDGAGYASGSYELDGDPGGATCRRTTTDADVRLTVSALGAVVLGAHTPTTLWQAGWVEQCREGAVRQLTAMLAAPRAPWCNTWF